MHSLSSHFQFHDVYLESTNTVGVAHNPDRVKPLEFSHHEIDEPQSQPMVAVCPELGKVYFNTALANLLGISSGHNYQLKLGGRVNLYSLDRNFDELMHHACYERRSYTERLVAQRNLAVIEWMMSLQ